MLAIWREAVASEGLGTSMGLGGSLESEVCLGLDKPARGELGSAVAQIPEKSGLPSAKWGVGADMFTLPSGLRGTPAVGYFTHWAASGVTKIRKARGTRGENRYRMGLRIHQIGHHPD